MERTVIFMPLLDEDVDVWRPVDAERLPDGRYRLLGEPMHPDDELWAFAPGSIVTCEKRIFSDGIERLAAASAAN